MGPLMKVDQIGYRYNHQWVIKEISFELRPGELVGLIGPNGSGKTTLLKCLSRIFSPQEGEVSWEGRPLSGFSQNQIARNIALVSQETSLVFSPTVIESVLMGRSPFLRRFRLEGPLDLQQAEAAMERTQVSHLRQRLLSELSSGERQRVYLSRALCQQPKLLLLDEPTAFLDIQHQVNILDLVLRLNLEKKLTILVASHDINLTAQYCQRLIMIREGRIEKIGTPNEVIEEGIIEKVFGTRVAVDENPFTRTPRITLMGGRERIDNAVSQK
jgi:iron complex transport system ATP-binding protein